MIDHDGWIDTVMGFEVRAPWSRFGSHVSEVLGQNAGLSSGIPLARAVLCFTRAVGRRSWPLYSIPNTTCSELYKFYWVIPIDCQFSLRVGFGSVQWQCILTDVCHGMHKKEPYFPRVCNTNPIKRFQWTHSGDEEFNVLMKHSILLSTCLNVPRGVKWIGRSYRKCKPKDKW